MSIYPMFRICAPYLDCGDCIETSIGVLSHESKCQNGHFGARHALLLLKYHISIVVETICLHLGRIWSYWIKCMMIFPLL